MAGQQEEAVARYLSMAELRNNPRAWSGVGALHGEATQKAADAAMPERPALINRIMLDVTEAQIALMELGRWANATTGYENREMGCFQDPEQAVVVHGRLHDLERTVGALRSELDRLLSHLRGV